jgi:hypothetical protein
MESTSRASGEGAATTRRTTLSQNTQEAEATATSGKDASFKRAEA